MDATYVPARDVTIAQPGEGYYVTLRRGGRTAFLAGPYDTHGEALTAERRAFEEACRVDPRCAFDPVGTCKAPTRAPGRLNARLAETPH